MGQEGQSGQNLQRSEESRRARHIGKALAVDDDQKVLCMLPGLREGERRPEARAGGCAFAQAEGEGLKAFNVEIDTSRFALRPLWPQDREQMVRRARTEESPGGRCGCTAGCRGRGLREERRAAVGRDGRGSPRSVAE